MAAAHDARGEKRQGWFGLAAGNGAGQRFAMRPTGIVTRVASRTSGISARQQPRETEESSTSLLPHEWTGRRHRAAGRSRPAVAGPPPTAQRSGGRVATARLVLPWRPAVGAGQRFGTRPRAGIVIRAARRTSGPARQQPQETEGPPTACWRAQGPRVPHSQIVSQRAGPPRIWCFYDAKRACRADGRSRHAVGYDRLLLSDRQGRTK